MEIKKETKETSTKSYIEVYLNQKFELKERQIAILKDYKDIEIEFVRSSEPSGSEALFVGILELRVSLQSNETKTIIFEIESPTAPRSYDVFGTTINLLGYRNKTAVLSVNK